MSDAARTTTRSVEFGAFLTPEAANYHGLVRLAVRSDELGLDLIGIQDQTRTMLDLIGRAGDGWLRSSSWAPPELDRLGAFLDDATAARDPLDVRRVYNTGGVIVAPAAEQRITDFIFGPQGDDPDSNCACCWVVAPTVRERLSAG